MAKPSPNSRLPDGLAALARRALAPPAYTRLEQFAEMPEAEIQKLHGMGPKAIEQIRSTLAARGITFTE